MNSSLFTRTSHLDPQTSRLTSATLPPSQRTGTILAMDTVGMPNSLVMETPVADYRLERWIAIFLALLFFLPFVANAQEAAPLALVCSGNSATLQYASSATPSHAWIVRDPRLVVGEIEQAVCSELPVPTPARVFFNGAATTLDYRCGEADDEGIVECALERDGEPIAKRVAFENEQLKVLVSFAGDLDRDGQLDLLLDVARNRFEYRPVLFLSAPKPAATLLAAR